MLTEAIRLGLVGRLPALGLHDFSMTMWVMAAPGVPIIVTPSWRIFRDTGHAEGHVNAQFAPRCDFHTYEQIYGDRQTALTLVRKSGSLFWYINFDFDNEDHGTEYDLAAEDYSCPTDTITVLWPGALTPKAVRDVVRRGP